MSCVGQLWWDNDLQGCCTATRLHSCLSALLLQAEVTASTAKADKEQAIETASRLHTEHCAAQQLQADAFARYDRTHALQVLYALLWSVAVMLNWQVLPSAVPSAYQTVMQMASSLYIFAILLSA